MITGLNRFAKAGQSKFWSWLDRRSAASGPALDINTASGLSERLLAGTSHEFMLPELLRDMSRRSTGSPQRNRQRAAARLG